MQAGLGDPVDVCWQGIAIAFGPKCEIQELSWKQESQSVAHFSRECLIQDGGSLGFVVVFARPVKDQEFLKNCFK